MSHTHSKECNCKSTIAVQSLDEMDFERGIWTAALYNDLDQLNQFIERGQQNAIDKMGYTPLHYASRNGHYNACELLLNARANVNATTKSGAVTPLMRASMMGHEKIVALLLRQNADAFLQDNDGNTALHKAAQNGHKHITEILLKTSSSNNNDNPLENIRNKKGQIFAELFPSPI